MSPTNHRLLYTYATTPVATHHPNYCDLRKGMWSQSGRGSLFAITTAPDLWLSCRVVFRETAVVVDILHMTSHAFQPMTTMAMYARPQNQILSRNRKGPNSHSNANGHKRVQRTFRSSFKLIVPPTNQVIGHKKWRLHWIFNSATNQIIFIITHPPVIVFSFCRLCPSLVWLRRIFYKCSSSAFNSHHPVLTIPPPPTIKSFVTQWKWHATIYENHARHRTTSYTLAAPPLSAGYNEPGHRSPRVLICTASLLLWWINWYIRLRFVWNQYTTGLQSMSSCRVVLNPY